MYTHERDAIGAGRLPVRIVDSIWFLSSNLRLLLNNFATRETKEPRLLSGRRNRESTEAEQRQLSTRIRRAHVRAAERYLPFEVGCRVHHRELYILFLGILGLYAKNERRKTSEVEQFADIIDYIVATEDAGSRDEYKRYTSG
ncbi:uncharacterized protein LOC105835058 [Monomorium pharaonis]|uniref:uncharacterized protein LOC105835058 n=1 Tax=Monomorium pharaonis TaxID=307658 RepID=UPI00174630F3|nr:uncharacterized protein LOC105835058 [Monomorium pharaonis]